MANQLSADLITRVTAMLAEQRLLDSEVKWELFPPDKSECDLTYHGKRSEESILADCMAVPLQDIRSYNNGGGRPVPGKWYNRLIFGDNLQAMKSLMRDPEVGGQVKLVYIDPPFASSQEFSGTRDQKAYEDKIAGAAFIEFLRKRLLVIHRLLSPDGSIFVHLDQRKVHYIKVIMDEIFGEQNFRNEIVLPGRAAKNLQQQFDAVSRLNVRHDTLLWYSASPATRFEPLWVDKHNLGNPEGHWHHFWSTADRPTMRYELFGITPPNGQWTWREERALRAIANYDRFLEESGGRTLAEYWRDTGSVLDFIRQDEEGKPQYWRPPADSRLADTVWSGVPAYDNKTKYPTEKHERLLEQVIQLASSEGDLVMDCFAGSGTTLAVAERLGRRWIGIDSGKLSIYTIQKRLLQLPALTHRFDSQVGKPFVLQHAGLYDFSSLADLPWEDWRFFALQLFECADRPHEIGRLPVDGERKGAPVLVYNWKSNPKERISEETIHDIHQLIGAQLPDRLYIIAPISVFDFFQDFILIGGVRYTALRIPYRIIEDLHRSEFRAVIQARDEQAINTLQEAYGFSFMSAPDVEWEVGVDRNGKAAWIKTLGFMSHARLKGNERDGGLDTLSMLLVDLDYDGRTFNLCHAFYGDTLRKGQWTASFSGRGLGERVMAVWVDHHGNEGTAVISREAFGLMPGLGHVAATKLKPDAGKESVEGDTFKRSSTL